jgi:hypothetical protein
MSISFFNIINLYRKGKLYEAKKATLDVANFIASMAIDAKKSGIINEKKTRDEITVDGDEPKKIYKNKETKDDAEDEEDLEESVEQIDELSKRLVTKYVNKASKKPAKDKVSNRLDGMKLAAKKLAKEEVKEEKKKKSKGKRPC